MRIGRTEWNPVAVREHRLAAIEVGITLTAITVWNGQIDPSVAVEVGRGDRRRWFVRERQAIRVEAAVASIEADVVRWGAFTDPIRDDDIG
jgi:hypothetical protein